MKKYCTLFIFFTLYDPTISDITYFFFTEDEKVASSQKPKSKKYQGNM